MEDFIILTIITIINTVAIVCFPREQKFPGLKINAADPLTLQLVNLVFILRYHHTLLMAPRKTSMLDNFTRRKVAPWCSGYH